MSNNLLTHSFVVHCYLPCSTLYLPFVVVWEVMWREKYINVCSNVAVKCGSVCRITVVLVVIILLLWPRQVMTTIVRGLMMQ